MEKLPRDILIDTIYEYASKDKDVYFLSADLGAKALDKFREDLPKQFIHCGISEQNMVDLAAGLALSNKKVYIYAMAPFVTFRCFEQIKVSLGAMDLPVTIIGIGAGYSYDDAGPTHYAIEDISCMRVIPNIEIIGPSDSNSVLKAAELTYTQPALRYLRLDRKFLPDIYDDKKNINLINETSEGEDIVLLTNGYMHQKALKIKDIFKERNVNIGIVDIFSIKPIDADILKKITDKYNSIIILEEHFLNGGLSSAICESLIDLNILKPTLRIGIIDKYLFDNGGREYIHTLSKIDIDSIVKKIDNFIA